MDTLDGVIRRRMRRDIMYVDGVTPDTKERLQAEAMRLYGKANASLLVRQLIADHLLKSEKQHQNLDVNFDEKTDRIQLRLPVSVLAEIEKRSEEVFSTKTHYINALIYADLGQPQLQTSEIEVLRRSNYELAKIGTNLNQVAKAFNLLVLAGGGGKLPEIGKKIASLRKEITEHTRKVLRVLESGTTVMEAKGQAQAKATKLRMKSKRK
jgi:predicted DNA binding CopG/RHH family protein